MNRPRLVLAVSSLWLAAFAFLELPPLAHLINAVIVGTTVVLAGLAWSSTARWRGWTATLLGVWILITGAIVGLQIGDAHRSNSILVSAALVLLAYTDPVRVRK